MQTKNQHTEARRASAPAHIVVSALLVAALASVVAANAATYTTTTNTVTTITRPAQAPSARRPAQVRVPPQSPPRRVTRAAVAGRIPAATLLRIVRAEDERRWDAADLGALLNDRSAAVRGRAALAAGRIGDEGAVAPLAALLLRDANMNVRATAAFALGETELGAGAGALLESLRTNKATAVRARALEALGKIAAALPKTQEGRQREIGAAILLALGVEHKLRRPSYEVTLLGLTAALRARPENAGKTIALFLSSADARVRADAANALARLRSKDANEQLRALLLNDRDPVVRANAARALGAAEDAASFDALLARSADDPDERVRVSAVRSLGALGDARTASPLLLRGETLLAAYRTAKVGGAPNPPEINELLEISTTIGRVLARTGNERGVGWLRALREAVQWSAPEVEVALARVSPSQYVREKPFNELERRGGRLSKSLQWQSISSLAQGLGEIAAITGTMSGNSAVSLQADAQLLLRGLLNDPDTPPNAMTDVLRALAAFKPIDLPEALRAKLAAPDVLVRATAADLLAALPSDMATTRALAGALTKTADDQLNDAALSILGALAAQKNAAANEAIKSSLEVPDYLIRRRAATLLRENGVSTGSEGGSGGAARIETVATRNREADYLRALARVDKRVRAFVATDKGAFTIELLPADAPLTVDNFVQLARSKFFDGITFHRVVPNFVVQGGDPRGDGNGGPGYQIRCEINDAPYERGAVGMALSGKDTGGSQWFVTHSPQPHLDGGYTVFGRVVEGMETVDRLARGDRIRSVVVTESK